MLSAWGIVESGHKVLLGLAPGTKEDTASCRDFLQELKARGLVDPILGTTEGARGLIRAFEAVFSKSLRQGCLAHKIRNLEAKVPAEAWREVHGARRLPSGQSEVGTNRQKGFVARDERDGLFPR